MSIHRQMQLTILLMLCKLATLMPRYLYLHGYRQNAAIAAAKINKLFGAAEIIIPNGPLVVEEEFRGWLALEKSDLQHGNYLYTMDDYQSCSQYLANYLSDQDGNFDAIIGFSQGCLAAIIGLYYGVIKTKKLIFFSPVPIAPEFPLKLQDYSFHILLMVGDNDSLVPPEKSQTFTNCLGVNEQRIVRHRWGHVVPSSSPNRQLYQSFLQN